MLSILSIFVAALTSPGDPLGGGKTHVDPDTPKGKEFQEYKNKEDRKVLDAKNTQDFKDVLFRLEKLNRHHRWKLEKDAEEFRALLRPFFLELLQCLQDPDYVPSKGDDVLDWTLPIEPTPSIYRLLMVVKILRKHLKVECKTLQQKFAEEQFLLEKSLSDKKFFEKQLLLETTLVLAALNYLETKLLAMWYRKYWMENNPDVLDAVECHRMHKILKLQKIHQQSMAKYIRMMIKSHSRLHKAFMNGFKNRIKNTYYKKFKRHLSKMAHAFTHALSVVKKRVVATFKPKERIKSKTLIEKALDTHEKILALGIIDDLKAPVELPKSLAAMLELRTLQALFEQVTSEHPNVKMTTFIRAQQDILAQRTQTQLEVLNKLSKLPHMPLNTPELIRVLLPFLSTTVPMSDGALRSELAKHPVLDKKLQAEPHLLPEVLKIMTKYQRQHKDLFLLSDSSILEPQPVPTKTIQAELREPVARVRRVIQQQPPTRGE